ncbi:MAG: GHKL domain-containing protein [Calothrix sp. FI2-JRJ7]|jgi:signal transduction histidine kinase|nr:GHKL domain-containing protein [Calothrix sp. FI2-JRJ7]
MLNELLVATNGVISFCYFIIAFLILLPYLRGEQKTSLVLATILVFFSCALGHGGHVLMMLSGGQHLATSSPLLLKLQVVVDSSTAIVAITYIALRRYFSFLVDGPLLLTQAQHKLEIANTELKELNTKLESLVTQRTIELSVANEELLAKDLERKEIISALKRSNAFLKAQQETGVDGILVVDEFNQVLYYNQKFHQIWQIPEELVQQGDDKKILELVVTKPLHEQEFITRVNYLYQHPEIASRDEIFLKDGRVLDRFTSAIHSSEGTYYGRIWFFRDVTERKTALDALLASEALLKQKATELKVTLTELQHTQVQLIQSEKMSALGQLVAGVAHEVNNPVNFIYGNLAHTGYYVQDLISLLDIYKQEYPNPSASVLRCMKEIDYEYLIGDLPQLLTSMKVGAERIREIVLSLRTFSRLDEAAIKKVDIHKGLDSTLLILQNRLTTKAGVEIQIIKKYVLLPEVECYPSLLNQVFLNILSNAIDALKAMGNETLPTIQISTELADQKQVIIKIADNGCGIAQSVQPQIFNPFFTTKPVGQGKGLGLAICYKIIVDTHGGTLEFISKPGWTEFIITIPLLQGEVSYGCPHL